jgi:predicted nucleic acid-binding protein
MADSLVVVDASAVAALLLNEPSASRIGKALEERSIVAPSLLAYEVANVAVRKIQLYPEQAEGIRKAMVLLDQLVFDYVQISPHALVESAEASRLTSYDAAYLYLSRELGLPLLTMDKALRTAAKHLGVETIDY